MGIPLNHIPLSHHTPSEGALAAAKNLYQTLSLRRSVRFFSSQPVPIEVIESCIACAGTAPSGANKQPWRFIAVQDPQVKKAIRDAAEEQEREFYERRATPEWLADLAPLGTDASKEFLETAPWLIVVMKLMKTDPDESGHQGKVYYNEESVGIATGMLITALHMAGLVTLTHTPSPMGFLSKVLNRPAHERPYLLLPVGFPAAECPVPDIKRKPLGEIMVTM